MIVEIAYNWYFIGSVLKAFYMWEEPLPGNPGVIVEIANKITNFHQKSKVGTFDFLSANFLFFGGSYEAFVPQRGAQPHPPPYEASCS